MSELKVTQAQSLSSQITSLPVIPVVIICVAVIILGFGIYELQGLANQDETVSISSDSNVFVSSTSAEPNKPIYVDINGAVVKPGVYALPEGSLIKDVVQVAGGWREDADANYIAQELNLAEEVTNQAKIYIPFVNDPSVREEEKVLGSTFSKVKINSATQKELESLEGIGEARAEKIIEQRPYKNLQELVEKKIISSSVFEAIKDHISL